MVDYGAVGAVAFILHFSCKLGLAIPEGWIPQTTLGWSQENASWYLHLELVLLISVGANESAKIGVFHTPNSLLYLMVFINESILLSFPFTSGVNC